MRLGGDSPVPSRIDLPQLSDRVIHDNLNGRVNCSALEMAVIKSATFCRLGRIQQLGLASWVFPGATHTRSSHSIGVMHAVGKLCRHLELNDEMELLRLGGLLHDIGQYPLSHCIEFVYRGIGNPSLEAANFANPDVLAAADQGKSLLQRVARMGSSADEAKDKAIGRDIIAGRSEILDLLHAYGKNEDFILQLSDLVAGRQPDSLHQQLLNSDYDCDRLDYVRRDSLAAGVDYGQFDLDFLIETFIVKHDPPTSSNRIIAIDEAKGVAALEQYLLARYNMYSQIVFHKTIRSLELLSKAAFVGLAEVGKVFKSYAEISDVAINSDAYLAFDDSYFWGNLVKYSEDQSVPEETRDIISRVLHRRPLKLAYEYRTIAERNADQSYGLLLKLQYHDAQLQAVADEAAVAASSIVIDVVPAVEFVPGQKDIPADQFQRYLSDKTAGLIPESDVLRSIQLAPRVWDGDKTRLMTSRPGSLLGQMIGKQLSMIRFYILDGTEDDATRLSKALRHWSEMPRA